MPPLNLDDVINDMEIYDTDDPRRDVSLGYLGIGSRFSDISIGERKDRINNLISEIYCAAPLSSGNSSRKSLHQSIKRYASVDQVSDVDSVITGTTVVRYFLDLLRCLRCAQLKGAGSLINTARMNVNSIFPTTSKL